MNDEKCPCEDCPVKDNCDPWESAFCCTLCRMGADALRAQQERENPKPITNADRIRAMSDEELAKMMTFGAGEFDCYECRRTEDEPCDMNCEERCLEWLRKPEEEG